MITPSVLQWITLQVNTLFICDPDGRLRYDGEPGLNDAERNPAARFFMGRTAEGNIWRFRHNLPDSLVRELEGLCRAEPVTGNLEEEPVHAGAIRAALARHAAITGEFRGPAYWIPRIDPTPGSVVTISAGNAHLLAAHFPWARNTPFGEAVGPFVAAIEGGQAVSICFCSRLTPQAAEAAAEAGVETAPGFRGRGFASAAVAGWAAAVQQRGLAALYSTSWDNLASQRVARKLGMVRYGEDWSIG